MDDRQGPGRRCLTGSRLVLQSPIRFSWSRNVNAIIEYSGTQIRVSKGDVVEIDLREVDAKRKKIKFDRVLMVGESGSDAAIGQPYVTGAAVTAEVLE